MTKRHLLIVVHSQSGRAESLALAAYRGARMETEIETRLCRAVDADSQAMLWADAVIIVTPENFAAASGAIKDFFDRVYYPLQGVAGHTLPYALIISAGNDGSGCERQLQRILQGMQARKIQPTLFVHGRPDEEALQQCVDSGFAVAAGLAMGIF